MLNSFFRTAVLFFVTAIVLRLMGKRQLAQLQPYEVVITLMISDLATLPMADVEIPLLGGVVSILTLLLLHSLLSVLAFVSVGMRRLICGRPSVLVRKGKICEEELSRLCFDLSDLMEGIRAAGLIGLHETDCVVLETNGRLSVIPRAEHAPASAGQVLRHVDAQPGVPVTVVMDGAVHAGGLTFYGHDRQWLQSQLERRGLKLEDVFFMSVDGEEEIVTVLRRDVK